MRIFLCRKGRKVSRCHGRLGGGREDGAAITSQQLEPLRQPLSMVGARVLRSTQLTAQESIGSIAKTLAEVAGEPIGCAAPMRQFVNKDGMIAFGPRHRLGATEQAFIGHLDVVG